MAKLKPFFKKDGSVTTRNASGINDAGAAVLVMAKEVADKLGRKPLAYIKAYAAGAVDPAYMGCGVIPAVRMALKKAGWSMAQIDCIELNEAFAQLRASGGTIANLSERTAAASVPSRLSVVQSACGDAGSIPPCC